MFFLEDGPDIQSLRMKFSISDTGYDSQVVYKVHLGIELIPLLTPRLVLKYVPKMTVFKYFLYVDLLLLNVGVISISQSRVGIKLFHVASLKLFRKLSGAERREQGRSMQPELLATRPFNAFWVVPRNDITSWN